MSDFSDFEKTFSAAGPEDTEEIFIHLQHISREIARLENELQQTLGSLKDRFSASVSQSNAIPRFIEFQQSVTRWKTVREIVRSWFAYARENTGFDHALIQLKISAANARHNLLVPDPENLNLYRTFLAEDDGLEILTSIVTKQDQGILIEDVHKSADTLPWNILEAQSAILFPIMVQNHTFGFGLLTRREGAFNATQLTLLNLSLGVLSLLLFQHYYFFRLRHKYSKMLESFEKEKYLEFCEKSPLFIYNLDAGGKILYANTAALARNPLEKETIVGENIRDFFLEEERPVFSNVLAKLENGKTYNHRFQIARTNTTPPGIWEFYLTSTEGNDSPARITAFAVDVTRQYYREQKTLRNSILAQITQFSGVINGYLNHLLTVLIPNVSLIKSLLPPAHEAQRHLQLMEKPLYQAAGLVKAFLNYNLPEIEQPREVSLNEVIVNSIDRFKEKIPSREIKFTLALDSGLPLLFLHPERMNQLIAIFIQNSLEALQTGGKIIISTRMVVMEQDDLLRPQQFFLPKGKFVEISFQDNGPGIDAETMEHIFKPFFSTRIKNESLGLGLFIAYNIVEELGGDIFVQSIPGESTTFSVYIPIEDHETPPVPDSKEETGSSYKIPHILVIEDEYNIRNLLKEVLEKDGFEVHTAANGREGLAIFEEQGEAIDLVILDMVMPIMDGREAFFEIKKRKSDQKIIVISGYSKREEVQDILKNSESIFMDKPFHVDEIVKKTRKVLAN